jgi:hypothetical protein
MNHINTMLKSYSDDIVLGKIGANRGQTFANLIRLIRLQTIVPLTRPQIRAIVASTYLLAMGRQPILKGIYRNRVHSELMGGPEHTDSDFLPMASV